MDAIAKSRLGIEEWALTPVEPYEASNLGRIRNTKTGRILVVVQGTTGYAQITGHQVHRLVAAAFLGLDYSDPSQVVDHGPDGQMCNALFNLSLTTRRENANRAMQAGVLRDRYGGPVQPLDAAEVEAQLTAVKQGRRTYREVAAALKRSPQWVRIQLYRRARPPVREDLWGNPDVECEALAALAEGREVWRPYPIDTRLDVSNMGRVRDHATGRVRGMGSDGRGYGRVGGFNVHTMVKTTFAGLPMVKGLTVRHFPDPNKTNNRLDNLLWGTYADQGRDSKAQGLNPRGKTHPRAELDEARILEGFRRYVEEDWTVKQFAAFIGAPPSNASDILNGVRWAHLPRSAELKVRMEEDLRGKGPRAPKTKLTDAQVQDALEKWATLGWKNKDFAEHLGISWGAASQILNGKTWTHISRPKRTV